MFRRATKSAKCPATPSVFLHTLHCLPLSHSALMTAAQARRRYSSKAQSPLLPVWRVTTRSRLGTKAMNWPPGAGLLPGVSRDALAAATAFRPVPSGQFPAVRKDLRVEFPAQFGRFDVAGRLGRLVHEPLGDDLPVRSSAPRATCNRQCAPGRAPACPVRARDGGQSAVVILKPPVLDAERLEQRLDGELVVGLAGDGFAHQRGMVQRVRRIAAARAGSNASFSVRGSPVWPRM